ncbi:hypothetical protein [Spirosoma telluris]
MDNVFFDFFAERCLSTQKYTGNEGAGGEKCALKDANINGGQLQE